MTHSSISTGIGFLGLVAGYLDLLDDRVAGPGLHHLLDLGLVVTGDDHETARMRPHALVFGRRQLDDTVTAEHRALTAKSDRLGVAGPLAACDRLVDVANERLVGGDAAFEVLVH